MNWALLFHFGNRGFYKTSVQSVEAYDGYLYTKKKIVLPKV